MVTKIAVPDGVSGAVWGLVIPIKAAAAAVGGEHFKLVLAGDVDRASWGRRSLRLSAPARRLLPVEGRFSSDGGLQATWQK